MTLETDIGEDWARALRELKPGSFELLVLPDGSEFAILHKDDFEHLATQCGMRLKPRGSE